MNRKISLAYRRGYRHAIQSYHMMVDGELKIRRRYIKLDVEGKQNRKRAEKALQALLRRVPRRRQILLFDLFDMILDHGVPLQGIPSSRMFGVGAGESKER